MAYLVLYKNQSLIVDENGNSNEKLDFTFAETSIEHSCSVTWQNRMLVFGGIAEFSKQVSEVRVPWIP